MKFALCLIVVVLLINGVHLGNLDIDCFAKCFKDGVVDPICTKFEGTSMTAMNAQFIRCLKDCGSNIEEVHKGKCPGDTKFDEMIEKLQKSSSEKLQKDREEKEKEEKSADEILKLEPEDREDSGQDEILEDEILKDEL